MPMMHGHLPRVFIEFEPGKVVEMKVSEYQVTMERQYVGATRLSIDGYLVESDIRSGAVGMPMVTHPLFARDAGKTFTSDDYDAARRTVAGKAGEPVSIGGIPEECVLRCSACGFTDAESTHECSV